MESSLSVNKLLNGLDACPLDTGMLKGLRLRMETTNALLKDDVEIPADEQWLYDNPETLASLLAGIEDAKAGRVKELNLDEL